MFLCYLYDTDDTSGADFGDGTTIKVHRSRRMCFPMGKLYHNSALNNMNILDFCAFELLFCTVPIGPTKMQLFRDYYQVEWVDFEALEFEKACNAKNVKAVLGALGEDWAKNLITTAPFGVLLRVAEGMDSLRNLGHSGMSNNTDMERGAAIVCGLSQLGGLLFSAVAIVMILVFLVCAPIGSGVAMFIYRRCKRNRQIRWKRDVAIDAMLAERDEGHFSTAAISDETDPFFLKES
jgi:hypothetical protein